MDIVVADLHDQRSPHRIPLEGVVTIGTDPACSIAIEDRSLGRIQARISLVGGEIVIESVGTRGATRVNGEPIRKRRQVRLHPSAMVTIGDLVLRFAQPIARPPEPGAESPIAPRRPLLAPAISGVEHAFLDALHARPDDLDTRLVYGDWLEQEGRAAMAAVVRHAAGAGPLDLETRALASSMDFAWRALVWCGPIENCASVAARGTRSRCPRRWEGLRSGDDPCFRSCARCPLVINLVDTREAVEDLVLGDHPPYAFGPSLDRARTLEYMKVRRDELRPKVIRGRPARVDGAPRLAEVEAGAAWCAGAHDDAAVALDPAIQRRAAAAWAQAAREEHASIAAFGALSLQLLALGAPPDLLAACHAAALDEIRHAQHAFDLASSFAGHPLAPAPLLEAPRVGGATTPRALACDTLLDGCLNETAAAIEARCAARAARAKLAPILAGIADDEDRHAELAWQIVAWCVRAAGPDLAAELARALAAITPPPLPDAPDDPALLACGVVGDRGRAEALAEALARAHARLAAIAPPAAPAR